MDFSDRPSASGRANRSEKLLTKVAKLREWTRRFIEGGGASRQPQWSEHLFEHFAIVGLSPTMNVRAVTADIKTYVKVNRAGGVGFEVTPDGPREKQQYGLKGPALPAEVVYNFPSAAQEAPGLPADLAASLAGFCFPAGVRPELLERTPSMSALNEVIYSQPYQTHDDQSFVFLMKVADGSSVAPRTLYGVCCYMKELLHRPPAIARPAFPACNAPLSRYMVVAPRCYCLLTYYPFFALHFRVLQTILGLERLDRMTAFAEELAAGFPPAPPSSSWRTSETNDTERAAATASSGNSLADWDGASAYGSQGARQPPPQLPPRSTASARDSTDSSNASSAGDDTASTASTLQQLQQQQQQQYRPSRLGRPLGSAPQLASLQGAPQQQDDGPLAEGLRRQMSAAAAPAVPGATQITPGVGLPPPPTPFFTPRSQPLPAVLGPLCAAAAELVSPLVAGGGNRRAGQQVLSQPRQQAHQQPQQPQQQQQPGAVAGPSAAELAAAASNGLARIASVKRALEESLAQAGDAAGADQAQQSQQHHQQWQQARQSLPPQQRGHAQQYEVAQAEPSVVSSLGEPAAGFGSAFGQADSSSSSPSLTSSLHDPRTQQRPSLPEEPAKLEQNGIHMESVPAKPAGSAEEAQQQENLLAPTETTDYGSNPSADADSLQPPGQEQRGQQQQQQQQEEERLPCGSTPSQPAASTLGAGAEASAAYAAASSSSQTPLPPQRSASSPSSPSASVPSEGGARPGAPQAGGSGSGSGYASGQEDENVGGSGPASEAGSFVTATSSMARGSASSYSDLAGLGSAGPGTATPLGTPEADGASSRGLPSPGSSCVPSPCLLTPVAGGPEALWRTGDGHQLPAGGAHMEPAAAAPAASAIGAAEEAAEGAAAGPAAGTAAAEGIPEAARASCGDVSPAPASASVAEAQQSQQQQQQQHPTAPRSQPGLGADAPGASGVLPLAVAGAAVSHEPPMDDARAGAPTITEAAPAPAASPQAATGGAAPDQPVVGSVTKTASFTRVEVQVSTNTYTSPQPALAASRGNTPARSDILTGTPMRPYAVPPQPPQQQPQAATAAAGAAEAALPRLQGGSSEAGSTTSSPAGSTTPTHAAGQQWQQQQQQQQQVVRVTASNLDLSRPLDSLDLLSVYHGSVVPSPGQVFEFQPDPGLQGIAFERPDLLEALKDLGLRPTAASLPDIDASQNLGGWTVAALCRSLSLSNVLAFLTAVLLERQAREGVVVFCPNIGVLCGVVLSLVPMLLPFSWQSLLLPVLPASQQRLEIMEAPVPFVLGVLHKTAEVRGRCGGLVRVNVYKDKVKNTGSLPALPSHQALHDALLGTYSELRRIGQQRTVLTRPVHMVSDAQQVLAECFLSTLQKYFKALMADLTAYTITDVTADNDRVSVLLKDSFIDSFPPRDRAFIRQFAETQMFSVYCDAVTDNSPRV
ncbi:hypothetical protein N2152v2_007139 [Parachlorella kessleri]